MKQLIICHRKRIVGLLVMAAIISMKFLSMTPSKTAVVGAAMGKSHEKEKVLQTEERRQEIGPLVKKNEPYMNRWHRRFSSSAARGNVGGYVFFKHIRKAGGTSLRKYISNVFEHHGLSHNISDFEQMMLNQANIDISYVEQEFEPLDWQCSAVDPRWQESLNIIVLRHPIERHMSEFFFSGVTLPTKKKVFGSNRRVIQKDQLFFNKTYTTTLARFLNEEVPYWMEHSKMEGIGKYKKGAMFSRWYQDNFQLRALAGCSSGRCLEKRLSEKRLSEQGNATEILLKSIHDLHPLNHSYVTPNAMCTQFFRKNNLVFDVCSGKKRDVQCSGGCDGPCAYPTTAEGPLDKNDVRRAIKSLKAFDAILLMEKLKDQDESAFLNDVMGVPRDASFALNSMRGMNARVVKSNRREVTHYYRDLLAKLNLQSLLLRLEEENKLEVEFFNRAVDLHNQQMQVWKEETGWGRG
mmetsp:Transcript_19471/g.29028  ORF Transcript_19471/g.29028 Transcript_19471/m.29028 type:complete len:465 (-) Transcript_19471:801-2195(-)